MPVAILQRAQDLRDRLHRIRRRAAINARVQIVVGALHVQFGIHDPAQADADGGQLGREHLRIADHGRIGLAGAAASCLT